MYQVIICSLTQIVPDTLAFRAAIFNAGYTDQLVQLKAAVNYNGATIASGLSTADTIKAMGTGVTQVQATDTQQVQVIMPTGWRKKGDYTIHATTLQNADDDSTNNTRLLNFAFTDSVYARDNGDTANAIIMGTNLLGVEYYYDPVNHISAVYH